jgi:hypothetical protein
MAAQCEEPYCRTAEWSLSVPTSDFTCPRIGGDIASTGLVRKHPGMIMRNGSAKIFHRVRASRLALSIAPQNTQIGCHCQNASQLRALKMFLRRALKMFLR